MNRAFFYIIIFTFICSCKRERLSNLIIKELETIKNTTKICLSDYTWFSWDRFYVFPELFTAEDISKETGVRYIKNVPERKYRMIFIYDKKVIFEEDIKKLPQDKSFIYFSNIRIVLRDNDCLHVSRYVLKGTCDTCVKYILNP